MSSPDACPHDSPAIYTENLTDPDDADALTPSLARSRYTTALQGEVSLNAAANKPFLVNVYVAPRANFLTTDYPKETFCGALSGPQRSPPAPTSSSGFRPSSSRSSSSSTPLSCSALSPPLQVVYAMAIYTEIRTLPHPAADFSAQALLYAAKLNVIRQNASLSIYAVDGKDYWMVDQLVPSTTFPNRTVSPRNKPAEGVLLHHFRR